MSDPSWFEVDPRYEINVNYPLGVYHPPGVIRFSPSHYFAIIDSRYLWPEAGCWRVPLDRLGPHLVEPDRAHPRIPLA